MNKYTITSIMILLSSSSLAQESCMIRPSCANMGYTKSATDCVGKDFIRCPFDKSAYYCPEAGESCDFSEYPLTECPTGGNCTEFECDGITQYKLNSCQNSYELSFDGLTCNACNFTNYPLSTCDANGTCSDYKCGNVTKYKLDSCESGYELDGNSCTLFDPWESLANTFGYCCSNSRAASPECPSNANCTTTPEDTYCIMQCDPGYQLTQTTPCYCSECDFSGTFETCPENTLCDRTIVCRVIRYKYSKSCLTKYEFDGEKCVACDPYDEYLYSGMPTSCDIVDPEPIICDGTKWYKHYGCAEGCTLRSTGSSVYCIRN
ncbi:MAG: hypothetical protein E7012_04080 [Alphaproteobacteria bacterium]|nr:hypothetical protein [Alphaproteobacteria bacterium]